MCIHILLFLKEEEFEFEFLRRRQQSFDDGRLISRLSEYKVDYRGPQELFLQLQVVRKIRLGAFIIPISRFDSYTKSSLSLYHQNHLYSHSALITRDLSFNNHNTYFM